MDNHPKYIKNKIFALTDDQFGHSGFGLNMHKENYFRNFLIGKKDIYFGPNINNLRNFKFLNKHVSFIRCVINNKPSLNKKFVTSGRVNVPSFPFSGP